MNPELTSLPITTIAAQLQAQYLSYKLQGSATWTTEMKPKKSQGPSEQLAEPYAQVIIRQMGAVLHITSYLVQNVEPEIVDWIIDGLDDSLTTLRDALIKEKVKQYLA